MSNNYVIIRSYLGYWARQNKVDHGIKHTPDEQVTYFTINTSFIYNIQR